MFFSSFLFYITIIYSSTPGLHNGLRRPGEADLGAPVLLQLIFPGKIQMSNCQPPEYTLQNTKMHNIAS